MIWPTSDEGLIPIDIAGLPFDVLNGWLRLMVLIRDFEESLDRLSVSGLIPGGVHAAVGQEAVAVGAISALESTDVVAASHRHHHHALAKGVEPAAMMAELFGRSGGTGHGRGGTMHIADIKCGYLGGNGIVGAGLGIAMGAALAAQQLGRRQIAVGFFGEGGVNTGRTWEALNLAANWDLPLIAICENNRYAVETPIEITMGGGSIVERALSFGVPAAQVDGQDVVAMYRAVEAARERALAGDGPTFIEALTYRYQGHSTGQAITYRSDEEVSTWQRTRDPILRLRASLEAASALTQEGFAELAADARQVVEEAIQFAQDSPWPDVGLAGTGVTEVEPRLPENPS